MNKETLEKYLENNLSFNEISKMTGKSLSTIIYWANKFGLKSKLKNFKQRGKINDIEFRRCPECDQNLNLELFYKRRGDNCSPYCKKCTSIRVNEYRKSKGKKEKKAFKHSDETRERLSKLRIEYLKNNPEKHVWKNPEKFKSVPCENLKKVLRDNNINFIEEYNPSSIRHFSIDVAFPHLKIGIEVNGNQHYKGQKLKPYYQERHDFITNLGWKLYELHYSVFFDENKIYKVIDSIITEKHLFDFDYNSYLSNKLNKNKILCKMCGLESSKGADSCRKCYDMKRRKVERPSSDQLMKEIQELGYRGAGKKYGVSDNSIRKWLQKATN